MIRLACMLLFALLSSACAIHGTTAADDRPQVVSHLSQIPANVGRDVVLAGFVLSAHEAEGLYFRWSDLKRLNSQCFAVSPRLAEQHGRRVRVAGRLVVSECASELICLAACRKFELKR